MVIGRGVVEGWSMIIVAMVIGYVRERERERERENKKKLDHMSVPSNLEHHCSLMLHFFNI